MTLSVADATALLEKDDAEILALLGTAIDSSFHVAPVPKEKLVDAGRRWFEEHWDQLKALVCPHAAVRRLVADKTSDEVSIIVTLCGIISSHLNVLIAAAAAVLIVKRGLLALCDEG